MDRNTEELSDSQILAKARSKANDNLEKSGAKYRFSEGLYNAIVPHKLEPMNYWHLIFSHDFAKALWGTGSINKFGADLSIVGTDEDLLKELAHAAADDSEYTGGVDPNGIDILVAWQYHLQQMVLEENPIQYLKKFL